jgi:hypothetical protein
MPNAHPTIYAGSHPSVADGSERKRYIANGMISDRTPSFATGFPSNNAWTVEQLRDAGYLAAADALERYE